MAIINKAGLEGHDDFLGFTFNGQHSSHFRIIRVSNGDRYESELIPAPKYSTQAIPGRDGLVCLDKNYPERNFNIKFAYDDIHEEDILNIKKWLRVDNTSELIFDERPYIKYAVRVNSAPRMSYICFCENKDIPKEKRVYKGEGEVSFTAFNPWGKSVYKRLSEVQDMNKREWLSVSGLSELEMAKRAHTESNFDFDLRFGNKIYLYNAGNVPVDWKMIFKATDIQAGQQIQSFTIGGRSLYIDLPISQTATLMLDSNLKQLVEIDTNEWETNHCIVVTTPLNRHIVAGDFPKIPCGESEMVIAGSATLAISRINNYDIEYDFLYY